MTDTATLRSLADEIGAMRHQIRQRDATIIRLRAERDTLRAENESLRASNRGICKLADERVAEIHRLRLELRALREDADKLYVDGFADGANLRTVGERVMDLSEDFGVPVV